MLNPTDDELDELKNAARGNELAMDAFDSYVEMVCVLAEARDEHDMKNMASFEAEVVAARGELDHHLGRTRVQ